MRIAIGLEYDGTAYNGWQRQRTGIGVQALVEDAISSVANESIAVTCAGRTDTGVHATAQVAHFDTGSSREPHGWVRNVCTRSIRTSDMGTSPRRQSGGAPARMARRSALEDYRLDGWAR